MEIRGASQVSGADEGGKIGTLSIARLRDEEAPVEEGWLLRSAKGKDRSSKTRCRDTWTRPVEGSKQRYPFLFSCPFLRATSFTLLPSLFEL